VRFEAHGRAEAARTQQGHSRWQGRPRLPGRPRVAERGPHPKRPGTRAAAFGRRYRFRSCGAHRRLTWSSARTHGAFDPVRSTRESTSQTSRTAGSRARRKCWHRWTPAAWSSAEGRRGGLPVRRSLGSRGVRNRLTLGDRWRRAQRGWPAAFPVVQFPNAPLIAALGAWLVAALARGSARAYARAGFYAGPAAWVAGVGGRRELDAPRARGRCAGLRRRQGRRSSRSLRADRCRGALAGPPADRERSRGLQETRT
jgi:hypothetical protein